VTVNLSLTKTKPQAPAPITWQCVVGTGDCFREKQSGILREAVRVTHLSHGECHQRGIAWPDAEVALRPIDSMSSTADVRMSASSLCGSADWERLLDDDETTMWGGGTKVGPVGAR